MSDAPHSGSSRWIALTLACLVGVACTGGSAKARGLAVHEMLGVGTPAVLTLDRASATARPRITEAAARRSIGHPFAAPDLAGPLRQFGLARVTATSGLATEGTAPLSFHDRLAWVGVYEISKGGAHSCPGQPQPLPPSLPPVFAHYYFVVLVDASTGQQATWNEDMSGLLLRDCAATSTG